MMTAGFAFQSALGLGASGQAAEFRAQAVATDPAGDTFVSGSFRGTVGFDPYSTTTTLNSNNNENAFVAGYGPTGTLSWLKVFSGRATDRASVGVAYATSQGSALAVDAAGNVFVAGSFSGTVDVPSIGGVTEITCASGTEAFAAKFDPSGNLAWLDATGGASGDLDAANGLALDGSGGVVLAGSFSGTATLGPYTLQAGGASDAFVAHLDSGGQFLWAVGTRGSGNSVAMAGGVAVDPSGNVALAGSFAGTVAFDPTNGTASLASAGSLDAAVWKLDPAGRLLWARRFGSGDFDAADAVALDGSGNIYATGAFSGTVDFGSPARPDPWTAGPIFDAFVLKLDPGGNETWARGIVGPSGWTKGQAVAVDPVGIVHVAGILSGSADFDPGPGSDLLTSGGIVDAFAMGLDAGGNLAYAVQAGQQNANEALGIAVNASGLVAIVGTYTGPIGFGPSNVPAVGLVSGFVARLGPTPPPTPPAPRLQAASDTGASSTDGITSATSPTFDVAPVDASDVVELLRNGVVVAQRAGAGPIRDPGPLAQDGYVYTAVEVNGYGVAGAPGPSTLVVVLTTPPAAPGSAPALVLADDSGTPGDGITNVRQPRLAGSAAANSTVQLVDGSGAVYGQGASGPDGSYTIRLASPLVDRTYLLGARVVDLAGNLGATGPTFRLTIRTTPPPAPSAPKLLPLDDSGLVGDSITAVNRPRLTGSATAGLTVAILDPSGNVLGTATASPQGAYLVAPSKPLLDGPYSFRVVALDAAGNASPASGPITLVILSNPPPQPAAPRLYTADDTGPIGDGLTAVRRPRIVGTAAPNGRVDWLNPDGSVLASTTASSTGAYQLQPPAALAIGTDPIRVRVTDVAGNVSTTSNPFNLVVRVAPGDYFGDGKSGPAVFAPINDTFYLSRPSTNPPMVKAFGIPGDVPVSGDFFGLGHSDVAVYRPGTSTFYAFDAVTGSFTIVQLGQAGDLPVPADYDGDGKADFAVFRPSNNTFYVLRSTTNTVLAQVFAIAGDVPVPADYFGSGHADLAVYRPGTSTFFAYDLVTGAYMSTTLGTPGNVPVPADYEGIGHADLAVFNPANQTFSIRLAGSGKVYSKTFALPGDIPAPGDYFGDGRAAIAVYRPGTSTFYACEVTGPNYQVVQWGPAGLGRPILGPITGWFHVGTTASGVGVGTPSAGSASGGPVAASIVAVDLPLTVEVVATGPVRKPGGRIVGSSG